MSAVPGPQFNRPPQEAPTLSQITKTMTEFDTSLIPEARYTYLAKTGERTPQTIPTWIKDFPDYPHGATLAVNGPRMDKHFSADDNDPGALFSYTPPEVSTLHATEGDTGLVPSLLALAHKDMQTKHGAKLETPDFSLSTHSQKLVDKIAKAGLTKPFTSPDENYSDFEESKSQMNWSEENYNTISAMPEHTKTRGNRPTITERAETQRPLNEALAEGRTHLRTLLNSPKKVPVVPRVSQGTQGRLI